VHRAITIASVLLALALPAPALAADSIPGPVAAEVIEVVDGDTLRVSARIWLGQSILVLVRIRGIDAPEIRASCAEERTEAGLATAALTAVAGTGVVTLLAVEEDKYFGRVVADVVTASGTEIGPAMLETGLVRPYDGGTRVAWCDVPVASAG
jgi:micrococcal nuclease